MTIAAILQQGTMLARAILLARILSPVDFGLMGMAFVAIRAGEAFTQTGFSRALVQKRGNAMAYLDTVWVVSVLRGLTLFGIVWLVSPLAAEFFATPELTAILRTIGLTFVIQGLINPAVYMLERELAFGRQALPTVIHHVADLVVSVSLALVLKSVWGMVWGFLASKVVYVVASYVVRPYLPRFRFRRDQAHEFYLFGRYVFRGTMGDWVVTQLDRLVVGRTLGVASLGIYSLASRLASIPVVGLSNVIIRVAFPVFTKVQEDPWWPRPSAWGSGPPPPTSYRSSWVSNGWTLFRSSGSSAWAASPRCWAS
jgi:O-antigen/teichoic acid export membrane protein